MWDERLWLMSYDLRLDSLVIVTFYCVRFSENPIETSRRSKSSEIDWLPIQTNYKVKLHVSGI